MTAQVRRLLIAFAVAVLLAIGFGFVNAYAQDEDHPGFKGVPPSICMFLEPWGEAWFFFNCHKVYVLTVTTLETDADGTVRVVTEMVDRKGNRVRVERRVER